jgi:hypothetical protein
MTPSCGRSNSARNSRLLRRPLLLYTSLPPSLLPTPSPSPQTAVHLPLCLITLLWTHYREPLLGVTSVRVCFLVLTTQHSEKHGVAKCPRGSLSCRIPWLIELILKNEVVAICSTCFKAKKLHILPQSVLICSVWFSQ